MMCCKVCVWFGNNKTVVILFSRSVIHVDICLFCTAACKMGFIHKSVPMSIIICLEKYVVLLYHKRLADLIRVCSYYTCSLCQHVIYIHTYTDIFWSKIDADLYIYKIASLDSRAVLHYYIDQITKCGNPVHVSAANKHHWQGCNSYSDWWTNTYLLHTSYLDMHVFRPEDMGFINTVYSSTNTTIPSHHHSNWNTMTNFFQTCIGSFA